MALIGKIRRNSWLLVALLALGLIGFIMMDMTSGQTSVFGSDAATMANIDGRKLSINEFTRTEQLLYRNSTGDSYSQREFLWNYYVDETLLNKEADALGLGVSKDELLDMQFGTTNISPVIQQRFRDPNTFQVDRARLDGFKTAIENDELTDPTIRAFWAHQEKEIQTDRIKTKISNIVSKGMYVPTWQAEMVGSDQYSTVDFAYVQVPFDAIDNSDISLEDSDYQAYLTENAARYTQDEETRRIDYVAFNVEPSAQDIAAILEEMQAKAVAFEQTENDTIYVEQNYGALDPVYKKKSELDASVADTLFSMPVGKVYGPYMKDEAYEIIKVLDRKMIPDSVQARHILINAPQEPLQFAQANRTIDSLKNLIETGVATFDSLAIKFSNDPGSGAKGGLLDYAGPGRMVKPFNDVLFFTGEPGQLYKVPSQFGIHLIEILGRKYETKEQGVQIVTLQEAIVPSQDTQNKIERQVLEFVGQHRTRESLVEAVEARDDLELETSQGLKKNDYTVGTLGGGQSSRDMIKWAYSSNASTGSVSPAIYTYQDAANYFDSKYVVASLKAVQAAGLSSVANVRDEIEAQVINKKKSAQLLSAIQGKSMDVIAQQYDSSIDTTRSVNFTSGFIAGLGNEPKLIAAALQMEQGATSGPIAGDNGVYLIKVTNKPKNITPPDLAQFRKSVSQTTRAQVPLKIPEQLRTSADISDNRSRFY